MNYVSTGIEPLNVELETRMVDFMISNGLECEQLNKTLHLAANFIEVELHLRLPLINLLTEVV